MDEKRSELVRATARGFVLATKAHEGGMEDREMMTAFLGACLPYLRNNLNKDEEQVQLNEVSQILINTSQEIRGARGQ